MDDRPKLCFGSLVCSCVVLLFFLCFGFFLLVLGFFSSVLFSGFWFLVWVQLPFFSSPFQSNSPSFSSLFVSLPSLLRSRRRQMVVKARGFVAGWVTKSFPGFCLFSSPLFFVSVPRFCPFSPSFSPCSWLFFFFVSLLLRVLCFLRLYSHRIPPLPGNQSTVITGVMVAAGSWSVEEDEQCWETAPFLVFCVVILDILNFFSPVLG